MEKDVVLEEKQTNLDRFIKKRINENENLFTKEELKIIETNEILIKKMYILGIMNTRF